MKLKKSLGQNFLKSDKVVKEIVSAGEVKDGESVLEIGPGEGVLTKELLANGAKVIAIEKDDRLIPELQSRFSKEIQTKQLNLIHADILNIDTSENIFDHTETVFVRSGGYKLVANIPYYITGQIIRKFLESNKQPTSMTLLVQKEVAERIVAKDGKESLLSLSVKVFGDPIYVRTVSRGVFKPQPKVDSAILHIKNISKEKFNGVDHEFFFKVLHAGFAHKRKQLLPNLSNIFSKEKILEVFEKNMIALKTRAEDLSFEIWIKICKSLQT